jgi:hypothetical protein
MTLHPEQAEQIRRLLGTVEDWLLHTTDDVRDDLGGFLAGLSWSATPAEQLLTWLIDDLGEQALTLRPTSSSTSETESG